MRERRHFEHEMQLLSTAADWAPEMQGETAQELQAKFKHLALLDHCVEVNSKDVWLDRSKADPKFYDGPTKYKHAGGLQTCLDPIAKEPRFKHMKIALVDLSKGVGSPEFAASDDGMAQVYVASAAKIAAMLAAFQLRYDLRILLKLTKPASLAALYDEQRSRWVDSQTDPGGKANPFTRGLSLRRRLVLRSRDEIPVTKPRMPDLTPIFADAAAKSPLKVEFRSTGETKDQLSAIIDEFDKAMTDFWSAQKRKRPAPEIAALGRKAKEAAKKVDALGFLERLRITMGGIVPASNFATSTIVRDVGYGFMASVLLQTGLYDTDRNGGLWLGAPYWGTAASWERPLAGGDHQSATAGALAAAMTLLAQGRLVNPQASREMLALMKKEPNPTHPGIKSWFKEGLKQLRDEGSLVSVASKLGVDKGIDDCALIERKVETGSGAKKPLLYVAVGLRAKGSGELQNLILRLDKCILANNGVTPAQGGH